MDPQVAEALRRVQAAVSEAEASMQRLHTLPSARLPTVWDRALRALRPAAQYAALAAACAAMHSLGAAVRVLGSLSVGLGVAWYGLRRSSLSPSGAAAAALLGGATLAASFRSGLLLLTFFFTSSKITQLGEELKDVDEDHKKGGQRDWRQVFCNALVPTCLALAAAYYSGGGADLALGEAAPAAASASGGGVAGLTRLLTGLHAAFLGYYACCCGDTWSSELGQLSPEQPRLITTLRPVQKGTNGGVTLLGLAASVAGGLTMGLTFWLCTLASPAGSGLAGPAARQRQLLALGIAAGLVGSLIDSLLGATIQFTGYNVVTKKLTGRPGPDVSPIGGLSILDNNAVNLVSACATAALTAATALALFP
ncbi:hypothetical protein ABPG77_005263 [Micractinium sp. CCAP 211/92]